MERRELAVTHSSIGRLCQLEYASDWGVWSFCFDTCLLLLIDRCPELGRGACPRRRFELTKTNADAIGWDPIIHRVSHNVRIPVNASRVHAGTVSAIGNSTTYLHRRLQYGHLLSAAQLPPSTMTSRSDKLVLRLSDCG